MKVNHKSNAAKEKFIKETKSKLQVLNAICAGLLAIAFLVYFCDFFRISIDGAIENRVSGFELAFILFSGALKDSNNMLSLVNKKHSGIIKFASLTSLISLFLIVAATVFFVYNAVKKKPLLQKPVIALIFTIFVMLIIQIIACGSLASVVTQNYYAGCLTCIAQTLSYIPMIVLVVVMIAYFVMSYYLYNSYGIAFQPIS